MSLKTLSPLSSEAKLPKDWAWLSQLIFKDAILVKFFQVFTVQDAHEFILDQSVERQGQDHDHREEPGPEGAQ